MTSVPSSQFHVFKSEVSVFTRLFFSRSRIPEKSKKILTTLTSILLSFDLRKSEIEERGKRSVIWAPLRKLLI